MKKGAVSRRPPWTEGVAWVKDTSRTQTTFTDFGGSPWLFGPLSKKNQEGWSSWSTALMRCIWSSTAT